VSLGCPKNLVDSEHLLGLLAAEGLQIVEEPAEAEVLIVNTCAFITPAEEEAIEALLDLADLKTEGRCQVLLAAGCLPQRRGEELLSALPELDGCLGVGALPRISELVRRTLGGERVFLSGDLSFSPTVTLPRWHSGAPWLAYLRIADGCDHRCAFCTIPSIRGRYRSRTPEDLQAEFQRLVGEGVQEVCLIAQDTSAYGRDLPGRPDLAELLSRLGEIPFTGWLRLLYLHPAHVTERLLQTMAATPGVLPYLDLPLQHAAGSVLQRMGRAGNKQDYLQLVAKIRSELPGAALRSTFITGFPGETEEEFAELLAFLQEARLDRVSAFRYWPEEGTRAANLPGAVPEEVAEERWAQLMQLQENLSLEANEQLVGRRLQVLVEERREQLWVGRSYRDAPEVDGEVKIEVAGGVGQEELGGRFLDVQITRAEVHDLLGTATVP
jgi:ribosomal protein S12 methylthiotransferase